MVWFALATTLLLTSPTSFSSSIDEPVQLTFTITNDDQERTFIVTKGDFFDLPPTDFILRDNVRLRAWFTDEGLTRFHNFGLPILTDTTLYARWDYLNPALANAQLIQSIDGIRFESKSMTLTMPLYEPLAVDVRFQWQAAPVNSSVFENIGGANTKTFQPFRNGTFQYRMRYRIPVYNDAGRIVDFISYYSQVVTLTIYGQQSIIGYIISLGLVCLIGLITFLRFKRRIDYVVEGGNLKPSFFQIGEDITLLPKAKKPGHRFMGWYEDHECTKPISMHQMPMKNLKLYAKFKKTKTNR